MLAIVVEENNRPLTLQSFTDKFTYSLRILPVGWQPGQSIGSLPEMAKIISRERACRLSSDSPNHPICKYSRYCGDYDPTYRLEPNRLGNFHNWREKVKSL